MPHFLTGEIRRDVFRREGQNANGTWVMYGVDLSESFKDRQQNDERVYTNYRATFFAKSEAAISYYDGIFQKGKVIAIQCDALKLTSREGDNGTVYLTAEMVQPTISYGQRDSSQGSGSGQQQSPRQQPQRQQQSQPRQQKSAPKNDFDDDIPF